MCDDLSTHFIVNSHQLHNKATYITQTWQTEAERCQVQSDHQCWMGSKIPKVACNYHTRKSRAWQGIIVALNMVSGILQ